MTARLVLAYAIVYVGWGTTYLAVRIAVETMPVFTGITLRFGLAAAALCLLATLRPNGFSKPSAREWGGAALVGFLAFSIAIPFDSFAMRDVPSGVTCLTISSSSILMALAEHFFLGRRIRRAELLGGLVALSGVVLMAIAKTETGAPALGGRGLVLLVVGVSVWCLGAIAAKRMPLPKDNRRSTGIQLGTGAITALLMAALTGALAPERVAPGLTPRFAVATIYLGLFGSMVIVSAYNWLLRHEPMVRVNTYLFVNPVIAVLVGHFFAGEPLPASVLGALVLCVSGTAVMLFGEKVSARFSGSTAR